MDGDLRQACRCGGLIVLVGLLTAPLDGELITVFELLMQPHPFFRCSFQFLEDGVVA